MFGIQEKGELPDQQMPELYDVRGPGQVFEELNVTEELKKIGASNFTAGFQSCSLDADEMPSNSFLSGSKLFDTQIVFLQQYGRKSQLQVLNDEGGYVYKLDDMKRLERFVILGCDGVQYYANDDLLKRKNTDCINRIVRAGRGCEAVGKVKEISMERKNLRQDSLLYTLAVLARSYNEDTKKAAYETLSDICRIPTHLFLFIDFCEEVSGTREGGGTGWGRAHRKAISNWYTNFAKRPEKLARLVSKYKQRSKTTHKDVLRRAHPKCEAVPDPIAFILKYIVKNLREAKNCYQTELSDDNSLRRVAEFLSNCDLAMTSNNADHLCSLIREHKLSREHCSGGMLNIGCVWSALLPHMNVEALIRNLPKMTEIGLFATGSEEEESVVSKIRSINSEGSVREEEEEMDQELAWHEGGRRVNILHPYQILIGWMYYKNGCGEKSSKRWEPNGRIVAALEEAYYKAYQTVEPTGRKFFLAVHMSAAMSQPALGLYHRANPLDYSNAAATMMMVTRRTEERVIIKGFSDTLVDLHIERNDSLETVVKKSFPVPVGGIDCSLPMKYAVENRIEDIDVFVIYTDNQTIDGNVHASEALWQYREVSGNPRVKLIVCAMAATEFTIADPDDANMLDIVGFDSAAPRVISEFARE